MASIHVRGLCLAGYSPNGWVFNFLNPKNSNFKNKYLAKFHNLVNYIYEIGMIRLKAGKNNYLYFIKPNSIMLLAISRYIYRFKVFVDINDPIHLPEHLGRFSMVRYKGILKVSTGIVFESPEYEKYSRNIHTKRTAIIEDTPQFELSFLNYKSRKKIIVWFGSSSTSKVLENYMEYFKEFEKKGFTIKILGVDTEIETKFRSYDIKFESITSYNHEELLGTLSNSIVSFIPMPDTPLYSLRGNLKVKFSMACGCITLASDLPMHDRIINNGVTGFIFSDFKSFSEILENISYLPNESLRSIGMAANSYVVNNFNRKSHAEKICNFISSFD